VVEEPVEQGGGQDAVVVEEDGLRLEDLVGVQHDGAAFVARGF